LFPVASGAMLGGMEKETPALPPPANRFAVFA
jgi:hypothetical protein